MKILVTYLFGYGGDPSPLARQFFQSVAAALDRGDPIALSDPYEIGLVRDRTNGGLLVAMTVGNAGAIDDSIRTMEIVEKWFGTHGIVPPLCETLPAKWPALRPSLGQTYDVIDSRCGPTEALPQRTPADRAMMARRRAWLLGPFFLLIGTTIAIGIGCVILSANRPTNAGEWLLLAFGGAMGILFVASGWGLVRLLRGRNSGSWVDWLADAFTSPLE